jgi:hypothetical protein
MNLTPEQGIAAIRKQRAQRSALAIVVSVLAVLVTLGAVYMVYRDVPAPASPANAKIRLLEPYH